MLLEYAEGSFERMGHRLRQLRGNSRGERGEGCVSLRRQLKREQSL
jgi:hypothetical protein